jgi:Fe-S-cluster containining protein
MKNVQRRKILLDAQTNRCGSCEGFCCTYQSNSMKVTPVEALDMIEYLKENDRWNEETIESLKKTIEEFRLDKVIALKRGQDLRRTYTCPFFTGDKLGCSIAPEYKPYGCLAFNPTEDGISEWGKCNSQVEILKERENIDEDQYNDYLRQFYHLHWQKEPIPIALLDFWNKKI